ncbi:MAG: sulfite exporter TauE/SafE family protein [bacterium]
MELLIICISGLVSGIISGMFGVGGGFVLVPILVYILKQNMHVAIGTSLAVIVPTALIGTIIHARYGNVNVKLTGMLIVCAAAGSCIGSFLEPHMNVSLLRKLFAVLLILVAVRMFIK